MGDDITPAEVSRALGVFRGQVRDDITELRTAISAAVTAAVYDADQRLTAEKLDRIRADMEAERKTAAEERKRAQQWRNRRDTWRRWLISAAIIPTGALIVTIISLFRGGR